MDKWIDKGMDKGIDTLKGSLIVKWAERISSFPEIVIEFQVKS